eukprot:g23773.t1
MTIYAKSMTCAWTLRLQKPVGHSSGNFLISDSIDVGQRRPTLISSFSIHTVKSGLISPPPGGPKFWEFWLTKFEV